MVSCSLKDDQLAKENERLKTENVKLKTESKSSEETDTVVLQERVGDAPFKYLEYSASLALYDDKFVSEVFDLLFVDINTQEFLYNLSFLINPGHNGNLLSDDNAQTITKTNLVYDRSFYFFYLWKKLDKSPEQINELYNRFGKWSLEFIAYLSEEQREELVDLSTALLMSYEEVGSDVTWLEDMYAKTDSVSVLSGLTYFEKVSPDVKQLLSEYGNSNDIAYDRWAYSFWVRRHQEGNAEAFHKIIAEVNAQLEGYSVDY